MYGTQPWLLNGGEKGTKETMAIRAVILLASVLLMVGLAACGGGSDEPAPTATQPPTATPIPSDGAGDEPTATTAPQPTDPPSAMVGYEVGEMAPDFELTTIDGETLSLSDFQGDSPVLLYFFATW